MSWVYYNSSNNEYRYALGEVQDRPNRLLFCFGINPSTATPQKLDPTARRIEKIATEHGYDSWILLNICAQRATDPNAMNEEQDLAQHKEHIDIIVDHGENASGQHIPTVFTMHFDEGRLIEIEFFNADSSAMNLDEIFAGKLYINGYEDGNKKCETYLES
jgi:hypothetical protein